MSPFLDAGAAGIHGPDEKKLDQLPHVESFEKNEILMFDEFKRLTGLVFCEPTVEAMVNAVNEKTAAVFLFPATLYEEGIPT